jgi:hypothetical protein
MNCQDFEKTVLALARNQLLDALTREQGLAHAEVCVQCAARLAEERTLLANLRLVVAAVAKEKAPAHVEEALLTAFRAQLARREAPASRALPVKGRWGQWRMVAAWAAVILIAVLLSVAWLKRGSDDQQQAARQLPASPTPQGAVPVPNRVVNAAEQKLANNLIAVQRAKPRPRVRQVTAPESESATQFYLLAEAGELAPLESGRVVRVEVPVSTLITLGLPIPAESLNQSVQADLLLGQDGLARAIRFSPAGLISPQSQTKMQ